MATVNDLVELLFPSFHLTEEDIYKKYPPRSLKEGAEVTRFAPSPTGFLHTGSLFTAFIGYRVAKQSDGVFYLRIEDTDTKRTIAGSSEDLIHQLATFGIVGDEGYTPDGEKGIYAPYKQSERADIYKVFVIKLLKEGKAYPDFCSPEDLAAIRDFQEKNKIIPGYYGIYARDRKLTLDEQIAKVKAGTPWVIRFRSEGDHNKKIKFHDEIRGDLELADNDVDIVILKSDGLPTYHFAHAVDDHLMGTTLVTRGEEWIPSTPIHLELFRALGWEHPKYAHLPVIMKLDHGNKRKLSKRKDPEAAVSYFLKEGYPPESLLLYLMSIANSNFEEWTIENKTLDLSKFTFSFKKMALDGALMDLDKLNYFAKEFLSTYRGKDMIEPLLDWAKSYSPDFYNKIKDQKDYMIKILDIEKDRPNPRKDYAKYSDVENLTKFFFKDTYEELVKNGLSFSNKVPSETRSELLHALKDKMLFNVDESTWWNSFKEVAGSFNFALNNKEYKKEPEKFLGNLSDAAEILRIALTCSKNSPNLHEIIDILGEEETKRRLGLF